MKSSLVAIGLLLLVNCCALAQRLPQPLNVFLENLRKVSPNYTLAFSADEMRNTIVNYDPKGEFILQVIEKVLQDLPFKYKVILSKTGPNVIVISHVSKPLVVRVIDDMGEAQSNVLVVVKHSSVQGTTDLHGIVRLPPAAETDTLLVSGVNIYEQSVTLYGHCTILVRVNRKTTSLERIIISRRPNIGFHPLNLLNLPAAYAIVDSEALNRVIATNIIDHFSKSASGLLFGPNSGNSLGLNIRGRNTLYSFTNPLLVWDYFAYPGNTDDINPYDIGSVTILKDAAATSSWGTQSGNGVIVLSSVDGQYNKKASWTVTLNSTLSEKPNLDYYPWLKPSSFTSAEQALFANNAYNAKLYDPNFAVTPALNLFRLWRDSGLSKSIVDQQISKLNSHSSITDLKKYFYQTRLSRQYHASVMGGGCSDKYYTSFGYDYDPTDLVRNQYERFTLRGSYTGHPITPNLETSLVLNFAAIRQRNNNDGTPGANYPYARATDDIGNPTRVAHQYNPGYIDTAGNGNLQDWSYRPLQELQLANNRTNRYVLNLQGNLDWHLNRHFSTAVIYRLFKSWSSNRIQYDQRGFYVRDLVNQFADLNGSTPVYRVPLADILFTSDTSSTVQSVRAQLGYSASYGKHQWKVLLGNELNDLSTTGQTRTVYGYDGRGNPTQMDFFHVYSTLPNGSRQIPDIDQMTGLNSRYLSAFSNTYYTYNKRNTLYGSFRLDGSNFTGIGMNQKWGSSWSLGLSRLLQPVDSTARYAPLLKLRASYGCNGNVSNRIANLTIQYLTNNNYGSPQAGIANSPDPSLGWEKTWIENAGLDYAILRDSLSPQGRLHGNIDLYWKQAVNLLAHDSLALSTGYNNYLSNTGGIHGYGIDLVLTSENTRGLIKWESSLLLSLAKDWVSRYHYLPSTPISYVSGNYPQLGKSPTGLYSYRWAGLDSLTGDPKGYLDGQRSKKYLAIMNESGGGYQYSGSYQPTVYGSLLNTFTWKRWSLSARLGFKGGYWFRRSSVNYDDIVQERTAGHKDFDQRWQKPGDEKKTNIPSIPATDDPLRDAFYLNSEVLITKGDHLRWQDCQVSYNWISTPQKKLPFKQAILYLYVNNPGIIWKANHYGIDPDASGYGDLPVIRSWSIGCRVNF